jgi:hypothetical protein
MSFTRRTLKPMAYKSAPMLALIFLLGACNSEDAYNDDAKQSYAQEAQQKAAELAPAVGDWCGTMDMTNGNDFAVKLHVKLLPVTVQAPASQDPNLNAQQTKLQGALTFDVLDHPTSADYASHPDLMAATGDAGQVPFSNGDYYPQNEPQVTLPYAVNSSSLAVSGELEGDLQNGHFVGTWTANSNQVVGTFDLQQNCSVGGAS